MMINDELLHKWVNGNLNPEELEVFKQRPEYDALTRLYQQTANFQAPDFDIEKVLQLVLAAKKSTTHSKKQDRRVFLSTWVRYGIAASILLVAVWFFFGQNIGQTVYEVAKGEQTEGQLPDGSTFVLNAESKLTFLPNSWDQNRSLTLEGEAFFDVAKGEKFIVKTSSGRIQVLGTTFNVRERNKELEVFCESGKVAVFAINGTILRSLEKGEAVRISNNQIIEEWKLEANQRNWIDGIFRFRKTTLQTVLAELERQFNIRIIPTGVDTQTILSCNFQNKDLATALKTVLDPLQIKYTIRNENTVYLSK